MQYTRKSCQYNFTILVGAIKTGCMKTPVLKSRFCALHKPRAIDLKSVNTPDNVEGEVGESSTQTTQISSVIEVAIDKRVTRSATYYKVFCIQVLFGYAPILCAECD